MKTLTPGTLPTPGAWWDGYQASCPKCKARVEFEASDKPASRDEVKHGEVLGFPCPTEGCDGTMTVRKS